MHIAQYMQWLESLEEHVVSPVNPLKNTHLITANSEAEKGSKTAMSGYTIIETETTEAALECVKECSFLAIGGTIEVSELIPVPEMG